MEGDPKKPTREEIKIQCFALLDAAVKDLQEATFNFCCFADRFKKIVDGEDGKG